MLLLGWTLAFLFGAGLVAVAVVCRKHLAALIKREPDNYEIDFERFEGALQNSVKDINFGGRE